MADERDFVEGQKFISKRQGRALHYLQNTNPSRKERIIKEIEIG